MIKIRLQPHPLFDYVFIVCFPTLDIKLSKGQDLGILVTAVSLQPTIGVKNCVVMRQEEMSALSSPSGLGPPHLFPSSPLSLPPS